MKTRVRITGNVVTLFSWGYHGWGNATPQLVQAIDAIEATRGFAPPVFVDVRIRRSVRAVGFRENAFGNLVGEGRYVWMKALGNERIVKRTGPLVQIADPAAAGNLLDRALAARKENRRVIFFCGCPWPKIDGKLSCHRLTVTELLLTVARARKVPIRVVEWPGGVPENPVEIDATPDDYRRIRNGRQTIPMGKELLSADLLGVPWGTTATVACAGESFHRAVGPACRHRGEWCLPVFFAYDDPAVGREDYEEEARRHREAFGLEPHTT